MRQATKKKSPMDVNNTPPLIDQNQTFDKSPTLQTPDASGANPYAQAGASALGAVSQVGKDMSQPMQVWQTPDWMQNQGAIYKAQAPQQAPPYQAGSELGNSALL